MGILLTTHGVRLLVDRPENPDHRLAGVCAYGVRVELADVPHLSKSFAVQFLE